MINCKSCSHYGVCAVRAKFEQNTIIKFPDGKAAVVDMESAPLLSCDHYAPAYNTSAEGTAGDFEAGFEPAPGFGDGRIGEPPPPPSPQRQVVLDQTAEVWNYNGPGQGPEYAPAQGIPGASPARSMPGRIRLKLNGR